MTYLTSFLPCPAALLLACCIFSSSALGAKAPVDSGEVTLEHAYDLALASDQAIRIAYWEVRKANLLPWSAIARVGPQVIGTASYNRLSQTTTTTVLETTGTGALATTNAAEISALTRTGVGSAGISVTQPLIDFTVFPAYRLGKLSKVATRLEHQYTIRGTLFGVASAYYAVLKQQSLANVNRETLRLANEQLNLAQKRANVGEVTRTDVLRAQVTVESARQTLEQSMGALDVDRNTLANILNFAPNTPFRVAEPPDFPGKLPDFDELLSRAYSHREDLRVKQIAIDQDIARRGEIVGEYGPKVNAQFNSGLGHTSGSGANSEHEWQASVSVSVPFFTGGQREIDLKTASDQIEETRLARDQAAKSVEADVKQAWQNVRTFQQTLKAAHAAVVAAEQGYHDLEFQYREGAATSVDLQSALNDLNTARQNLTAQTYDYQVALRNLEQTSGVFQEERVQKSKIR